MVWNCGCEASLYHPVTGKLLQAFTENVREVYKIKCPAKTNVMAKSEFLIEIACQNMLGTYEDEPWGGIVKMDKFYKLKTCEIRLVDPKMEEYFWDIESIRDAAQAMKS